jgi:hypothetical protein
MRRDEKLGQMVCTYICTYILRLFLEGEGSC